VHYWYILDKNPRFGIVGTSEKKIGIVGTFEKKIGIVGTYSELCEHI
jgi:hypothetical protein